MVETIALVMVIMGRLLESLSQTWNTFEWHHFFEILNVTLFTDIWGSGPQSKNNVHCRLRQNVESLYVGIVSALCSNQHNGSHRLAAICKATYSGAPILWQGLCQAGVGDGAN